MNEEPILSMVGLTKRYLALRRHGLGLPRRRTVTALDHLCLEVGPGRIAGMLGPNGAGKTTALRVALGLVRPDHGTCRVAGAPVHGSLGEAVHQVAGIVDTPRFYGRETARTTLSLLARLDGLGRRRVEECIEAVGLESAADRQVCGFSLGMRQRLALAAALLRRPRLLLLDEPANGLDPAGVHRLAEALRAFADGGGTVVLSSHVLPEVQRLADEIVVVAGGAVVAAGGVEEMLRSVHPPRLRLRVERDVSQAVAALTPDTRVDPESDGALMLTSDRPVAEISRRLTDAGCTITELTPMSPSLEDRYLELVGHVGMDTAWGR